jgi:protein translocase SecG subunit
MVSILPILQIIFSLALGGVILLQAKGTGLGRAWGGGGEFYRSKRGAEKILAWLTVALACLFVLSSLINVIVG